LRGDGQPVTETVPAAQQMKALQSLLNTVSPAALSLPQDLIKIIPPRPLGYQRSREVIRTRTDLAFDPIAGAESASDMVFSLILNPARATRLVQQNSLDPQLPSLESVIDNMVNATFKATPKQGYDQQLQITANHALLNNLMKLALNNNASSQTRAVAAFKIDQLRGWLSRNLSATSESWKAHYAYELMLINEFREDPRKFEAENFLPPPPGQPIGQDEEFCSWIGKE
jgi:hypothetical protein